MPFKSHKQPLCRACGKKIKKYTSSIYFGSSPNVMAGYSQHSLERPRTKDEAQRCVNQKIVSVRRGRSYSSLNEATGFWEQKVTDAEFITHAGLWDGETYVDGFFCNRTVCAVNYAYMCVQSHHNRCQSVAYSDAVNRETFKK